MKNAAATVTEDDFFVLSSLPPSPAQKRLALGFVLSLLVVFGVVAGPLSVDRQRAAPDRVAWSAHQRGARQLASGIIEAMHCRSHLGLNKRCDSEAGLQTFQTGLEQHRDYRALMTMSGRLLAPASSSYRPPSKGGAEGVLA